MNVDQSQSYTVILMKSGYQNYTFSNVQVTDGGTTTLSIATLISSISTPTVTGISPTSGYNNNLLSGVIISGTGFASGATVTLTSSGLTDISCTDASISTTSITCNLPLTTKNPGTYNVVVRNLDTGTGLMSNAFTIINASAATVSSITPNYGTVNTTVSVTIVGTGFSTSSSRMRLVRSGYNDILGSVSTMAATQLTGTFDLTSQTPGTWTTRVYYDGTNTVDGPTFTINAASPVNGTISFSSNPSGASAYLSSVYQGRTPLTLYNVTPGTYSIRYQKSGYDDYSGTFTVTAGSTTDAYGRLLMIATDTTTATPVKTLITTRITTIPSKKTTSVVTPWPTATATKSPVDLIVVLGALGMCLVVLRKK